MLSSHSSLAFFDVGGPELMMVMLVLLLLFPSKRIPELARGIGKTIRDFKKAAGGFEDELRRAIESPPSPPQPRKPPDFLTPPSPDSPAPQPPDEPAPPPEGNPIP